MSRAMNRAQRLREMERLYLERAYTDQEMADLLGVRRETAYEDRITLETEDEIPFSEIEGERGRRRIDRTKYLPNIRVNLHEALALYLAMRRVARQTRTQQPHVQRALEKIALTLKQPMTERLIRVAAQMAQQPADPQRVKVMEDLAQGWALHQKVRIHYEALTGQEDKVHTISPYLIEPSQWSDTIYVIAQSSRMSKPTPFVVARITQTFVTTESFELPDDFDDRELHRYAWGNWTRDREPEWVKLKFTGTEAIKRMKETIWHPLQKELEQTPDGGWLWQAPIAEWHEMVPWVRGWGSDVEVVEPEELRRHLKKEVEELSRIYRVTRWKTSGADTPAHRLMWAKAEKGKTALNLHRLAYHLIDVGQVTLALWEHVLNENLRRELKQWLGLEMEETGRLIAFWASLHDLGKASPAFQDHPTMRRMSPRLHDQIMRELTTAQMQFPARSDGETRARHEVISTWALNDTELLTQHSTLPSALAMLIAQGLSGHHGAWHPTITVNDADVFSHSNLKRQAQESDAWHIARSELVRELVSIFRPPAVTAWNADTTRDNKMLTLVSAIVSVADWLGSDEENFPYEEQVLPLDSYTRHSKQHALLALLRAEWPNALAMPRLAFEHAFGFESSRAQQQVSDALKNVPLPALAIIEAPMGSGKTEAALAVYAEWAKTNDYSGLYVAMPTTATSNQMYTRVTDFLGKQFGTTVDTMLVHSQALLRDVPEEYDVIEEPDKEGDQAAQQSWFLPRKKSLLFPFGVGTVDQALMSVLQTKHFFVRLLGLHHKVVIFDEVHAYDAYMSELFERLLLWLRQLNVSVIVLSATLPDKTRLRLLQAYANNSAKPPKAKYPRLTFATADGAVDAIELDQPANKTLRFDWVAQDTVTIINQLRAELREGGCAVVVCNTIGRAQGVFLALSNMEEKLCDDENLILFHARFPFAWREELEKEVLQKFGPGTDKRKRNPNRPHKAIVIATQVVEQSLDLDFDVMVSDHAPIDLLLQRAGRLQRHRINDATRTHPYRLQIAVPEVDDGIPQFERADTWIYGEYVLLRSWLALNKVATQEIQLPDDIPTFIEEVYGEMELSDEPRIIKKLEATLEEMTSDEMVEKAKARKRLIAKPSFEDLPWGENGNLEEDDPAVHETFQALTRSDRPGINVVCLHRVDGKLQVEPDDQRTALDLSSKTSKPMIRELARHTVNVRHRDPVIERWLLTEPSDPEVKAILGKWKKIAALRYHRIVIFDNGVCPLHGTKYVLHLNKENHLGLQIIKEG